ncbi:uncharacterized protein METZ01_LOCUS123699 [marine metagenome]|uniref:DUF1800 domain-containing protein n=1 Tax=marine metagenome TaxID=408172 RepID=A0A381Y1L2_9ZZZZ|tara:strand:+ start:327 stop:1817 length:1491 start_codon:yes stop_codon:yes gene_type:complete
MNEQFRVAQKIGLMFHHDTPLPEDIKSWAISQLHAKSPALGISTMNPLSKIGPWPQSLQANLEDLSKRYIKAMEVEDKVNKSSNPDYDLISKSDFENYMGNNDHLKFSHRNIYGKDQVKLRFMAFWTNHFTMAPNTNQTDHVIGHAFENAILSNLNNSFAIMLYEVTKHPAMLMYLDNVFSSGQNSQYTIENQKGGGQAGLNDNLGRELLELHTVSPAAKYTESDIRATANVLSGWGSHLDLTLDEMKKKYGSNNLWDMFRTDRHEPGNKTVLGKTIYPGKGGLRQLTDFLANHKNTVAHLSKKLAEHFVSENPSKSDIDHIANVWRQSKGNLDKVHTAVIERAILSKEPKFQWPMTWLFQVLRLSNATYIHGWNEIAGSCNHCPSYENDGSRDYPFMQNKEIFLEIGQSFWHMRQPNGYSSKKDAWVSGEMFDRRIRFAEAIFNVGNPKFTSEEIMSRIGAHKSTRNLVKNMGMKEKDKFIALMCSPELMGLEYV